METIIAIVGFLGAGKTTVLKHIVKHAIGSGWQPYVVLNDYENAHLDAVQLTSYLDSKWIQPLTGSCICCGIMYGLLIKKSYNHKPETIEEIDFDKVIVTEVVEHVDEEDIFILKNNRDTGHWNYGLPLQIGAIEDNLTPTANPITDGRAWETGTYYYGVVYTNLSYNRSTFKYIEFDIKME
ncbi:hypothetical protein FNB79_10880 [Formosa sediminum]|uniref:CobW/HypB/UreG nucleotide-binding domain-containing protein n=1 Tax=Formosa sediminum TaxID=2594004 RepID=A0A516GSE9_9FLAO|nr:GTP-binding protein [Formosa sediminum]QDO94446.1 hypothetical protein FNB79_10880 [Formosa sediminum]